MLQSIMKKSHLPYPLMRSFLPTGLLPAGMATLLAIALVGCSGGGGAVVGNGSGDPIIEDPVELTFEATMPASLFIDGEKYISIAETYNHDLELGQYSFSNEALSDVILHVYQHASAQTASQILPAYHTGAWLLVKANSLNGDDYPLLQVIHDQITQTNLLENEKLIHADIQQEQFDEEEQVIFMDELEWALVTKVNGDIVLTSADLASSDEDPWDAAVQGLFVDEDYIDYFISFGEFDDLLHSAEEIQFIQDFFTSLDPLIELDFRQTTIFEDAEIGFYRYDVLYEDEDDFTISTLR